MKAWHVIQTLFASACWNAIGRLVTLPEQSCQIPAWSWTPANTHAIIGDKIYVIGSCGPARLGRHSKSGPPEPPPLAIWVFDTQSNHWTKEGELPEGKLGEGRGSAMMVGVNEDIYAYNVWSRPASNWTDEYWVFNTVNKAWRQGNFPFKGCVYSSCTRGQKINFTTYYHPWLVLHIYDTVTDTWEPPVHLPVDGRLDSFQQLICRPNGYQLLNLKVQRDYMTREELLSSNSAAPLVPTFNVFTIATLLPNNTWEHDTLMVTERRKHIYSWYTMIHGESNGPDFYIVVKGGMGLAKEEHMQFIHVNLDTLEET